MATNKPTLTEDLTGQKVITPTQPKNTVGTNPPVQAMSTNQPVATNQAPVSNDVIDAKTMAEIERKAKSGIALVNPTDAKMQAYNSFLSKNNTQTNTNAMDELGQFAQKGADAFVQNQQAQLSQARDNQILELRKAYQDAVEQGQMSLREAEEAFNKQSEAIHQQHYLDSKTTNLASESRGIQNSQQMLGLMAGDNARKNSLLNENMTTRDKRVADINDRIRNLKTKMDLDIANANSNFDYGMAGARAQADMQLNNQMFGLKASDYEANRNQAFNRENMAIQQNYTRANMITAQNFDLQKMDKQQQYVLDQMAKQFGYDIKKMDKQQQYQLAQMAQAFGYDMKLQNDQQAFQGQMQKNQFGHDAKMQANSQSFQAQMQASAQAHASSMMDKQHGLDLAKMAKSFDYDMQKVSAQGKSQLEAIKVQADAEQKAYQQAMDRELAKYKKGTPEYDIVQYQWSQKLSQATQEIEAKARKEAEVIYMRENYGNVKEPVKPTTPNWFIKLITPDSVFKGQESKYQSELEKYNAYQRYLKTGEMPPIK